MWQVIDQNFLAGEYYSVNPLAVNNPNIDVLTENCRSATWPCKCHQLYCIAWPVWSLKKLAYFPVCPGKD